MTHLSVELRFLRWLFLAIAGCYVLCSQQFRVRFLNVSNSGKSFNMFVLGGVLHPQESLIGVLLAIRGKENIEYCESATLKLPSHGRAVDFKQEPYRAFVREFQRTTPNTTLVVCWTVTDHNMIKLIYVKKKKLIFGFSLNIRLHRLLKMDLVL